MAQIPVPSRRLRFAGLVRLVPRAPRGLVFGMGILAAAALTFAGVRTATSPGAQRASLNSNPRAAPPSMEYPLGKGFGQLVSLADAASALGGPATLPDTAQVKPSDVGAVQLESSTGDGQRLVDLGISFPKQGMIVQYIQPPLSDPLSNYQVAVSNSEGSLIYLNGGVPALTEHSSLPDGSPWGFVQFVAGGSTILVMGPPDEATLQAAAQSILDQIGPS